MENIKMKKKLKKLRWKRTMKKKKEKKMEDNNGGKEKEKVTEKMMNK